MQVFIDILKLAQHVYNEKTAVLCRRTHPAVLHSGTGHCFGRMQRTNPSRPIYFEGTLFRYLTGFGTEDGRCANAYCCQDGLRESNDTEF